MRKDIELVKKLLKDYGAVIHPMTNGVMVYAKKGNENFVCSWLGSKLTVSVSRNGKPNKEVSEKIVKNIFGQTFFITHIADCPLDNIQANYFSLEWIH